MRRKHTDATRLAAIVLVKHAGAAIDDAAATLKVDPRTVKGWVSEDVPGDAWADLERMLLALAADRSARGELRNLSQILTGAGISSRNRRYGELIRQRDARKAEQDQPSDLEWRREHWRRFTHPNSGADGHRRLDEAQERRLRKFLDAGQQLLRDEIAEEARRRAYPDDPSIVRGDEALGWVDPPEERGDPDALRFALAIAVLSIVDQFEPTGAAEAGAPELRAYCRSLLSADEPDLATMSEQKHAAYVLALRERAQAAADAWWPTYCAAQKAIHTAERTRDGTLILRRHGKEIRRGGELPDELQGMPILVADVPDDAHLASNLIEEAEQFLLETSQ